MAFATPRIKKKTILLAVSLLALLIAVGGTIALLIHSTGSIQNQFTPAKIDVEVRETFEDGVKKDVKLENTGTADAYFRAAVVVTWANGDNIYSTAPVAGTDYTITLPANSGWVKGTDGFYYYTRRVPQNGLTEMLLTDCKMLEDAKVPEGYILSVEILAQAIQADGGSDVRGVFTPAVTQAWGIPVNADGTLDLQ